MWCKHCRQDVPGIVVAENAPDRAGAQRLIDNLGHRRPLLDESQPLTPETDAQHDSASAITRFVCARCGEMIGSDPSYEPSTRPEETDDEAASGRRLRFETWEWELDQELHDVRRLLDARVSGEPTPAAKRATLYENVDAALAGEQRTSAANGSEAVAPPRRSRADVQPAGGSRSPATAWLILAVGLMGLVCGGVLLGWSVITGRVALWNLGLPITLVGQGVMLIGLLCLLERIWREGRRASTQLTHVDQELHDLRHTTSLIESTGGTGAQRFYTHMAQGAQPHLLLADLKGQMDLLAAKISQQD